MTSFLLTQNRVKFTFITGFTISSDLIVLLISTNSPLAALRNVFGLFFSVFVPGYCLVWALFSKNELSIIETIVSSVGLSLALISIVALVVNFVLGNIGEIPIVASLSILTIAEAIIAYLK